MNNEKKIIYKINYVNENKDILKLNDSISSVN